MIDKRCGCPEHHKRYQYRHAKTGANVNTIFCICFIFSAAAFVFGTLLLNKGDGNRHYPAGQKGNARQQCQIAEKADHKHPSPKGFPACAQYLHYFYDPLFLYPLSIANHWFEERESKYTAVISYGQKLFRSEKIKQMQKMVFTLAPVFGPPVISAIWYNRLPWYKVSACDRRKDADIWLFLLCRNSDNIFYEEKNI